MADRVIGIKININGTDETVKKLAEVELELKAIEKALKDAQKAGEQDTYVKLRQQQEALKKSSQDLRKEIKLQQKEFEATQAAEGSYKQLNAQLIAARARFKELSAEERRGKIGLDTLQNIQRLDRELKQIDASVGQFQRNVGNYAGGLKGLFGSLRSTIRNTRLLQTAFSFLPGVGDAVQLVVDSFVDWITAESEAAEAARKTKEATEAAIDSLAKEGVQLDVNAAILQDTTKSTEDRKAALDELQKLYPAYFENIDLEKSSQEDIAAAYRQATNAINLKIKAQALESLATEKFAEVLKKQQEIQRTNAVLDADDAEAKKARALIANQLGVSEEKLAQKGEAERAKRQSDLLKLEAQYQDFLNQLKDVELQTNKNEATDSAASKRIDENAKKREKTAKEGLDAIIKAQAQFEKQRIDIEKATAKEIERQAIESIKVQTDAEKEKEKARLEAFKTAQKERLTAFDAAAKAENDKLVKVFGDGSKQVLDAQRQNNQLRIQLDKDVNQIIQNETKLSNEKLIEIDKTAAEKRAKAVADIEVQARKAALEQQQSGVDLGQSQLQEIKLKFDFDQQQSQAAFDQARAELELQLARGLITQSEFDSQLKQLGIEQLQANAELAAQRVEQEQAANDAILAQTIVLNNARLQSTIDEINAETQARIAAYQVQFDQGLLTQEQFDNARVAATEQANAKIQAATQANAQANANLQQQAINNRVQAAQQAALTEIEIEKQKQEQLIAIQKEGINKVKETLGEIQNAFNVFSDIFNQAEEARQKRLSEQIEKRFEKEAKLAFGNQEKIKALEEKRDKEQEKLNKRQAARQKAIAISQALINGALAVTNILANLIDPTPVQAFKAVAIGVSIATTAAQIATIAAQKFAKGGVLSFEDGGDVGGSHMSDGFISGPSHAQGGVKVVTPMGLAEVEGGEYLSTDENGARIVINKKSASAFGSKLRALDGVNFTGKRQLLSQINSFAGWGRKFQTGGELSKPLTAPVLGQAVNEVQTVAELQKQNALLQQNNSLVLQNLEELRNTIVNIKVVADPAEIVTEGNNQMIKKARTEL